MEEQAPDPQPVAVPACVCRKGFTSTSDRRRVRAGISLGVARLGANKSMFGAQAAPTSPAQPSRPVVRSLPCEATNREASASPLL